MPRSRARDDDRFMDLGFSGGESLRRLSLLSAHRRRTGTGSRVRSTAHRRLALDAVSVPVLSIAQAMEKAFYQNAQPAPKWSCLWGLGGSALDKQPGIFAPAKIPGLASVGPTRHCLPVSRTLFYALSGGISSNEKRGHLHILLLIICIFNLMAPSMTPSTMGRYFSGQSCNLWLVR